MPPTSVSAREKVLGYTLTKRLGSGAYGEVWSAEAPGGLSKAVKLVHGYHDEKRAQIELSALNKIKQVRHPFLLSLERIEVSEGQLVVVTELADKSLKDVYDEYRQQRQPGIPREELLGYMRDAADALDFLSQKHGLQHLDVKPENLLLLSGHIKVADFGLLKDLQDVSQSLLGGMTPAYAPPELFDGRPASASDQYSLAIVYQEMLTGERPFTGKTAAQLAAEQMKARPQLTALPFGDQQVVAKALAKDPKLRYESCRAFVDDLVFRRSRVTLNRQRFVNNVPRDTIGGNTSGSGALTDATLRGTDSRLMNAGQPATVLKLPPWPDLGSPEKASTAQRPAIFIGIGNTATTILRRLRQRFTEPSKADLLNKCIRFLCLDTDRRQLLDATREADSASLRDAEILPVPLRRPEEYRSDSSLHLSWLSRRWIYNIPRSLQTEGLRPFGRLAFADHAQEFFSRLTSLLSDFGCNPSGSGPTSCCQASKSNPPRVFIVTSSSGGIGSGMVIDAGYTVRTALRELGLPDDDVTAILVHSTAPMLRDRSLCVANTFACLNELHHFDTHGFPGDPSCGLPPFEKGESAFSRTYLLDLGNCAEDKDYFQKMEGIADYLYLNSVTPGTTFFDRSRSEEVSENSGLRTFGLASAGVSQDELDNLWVPFLCRKMLRRWVDPAQGETGLDFGELAQQWALQYHVTHDGLNQTFANVIEEHIRPGALQQLVDAAFNLEIADEEDRPCSVEIIPSRMRQVLEFSTSDSSEETACWKRAVEASRDAVAEVAKQMVEPLRKVVLTLVDEPHARLSGSIRTLDAALNLVQKIQDQLQQERQGLQSQQESLIHAWRKVQKPGRVRGRSALESQSVREAIEIAGLVVREFILDRGTDVVNRLRSSLSELKHPMMLVRRELLASAERFPAVEQTLKTRVETAESSYDLTVAKELWQHQDKLLTALDQRVQGSFLDNVGGLLYICVEDNTELKKLPHVLTSLALSVLSDELKGLPVADILRKSGMKPQEILDWSKNLAKNAWPGLLRCGGNVRALLCLPESTQDVALARLMESQERHLPTVIPSTSGQLTLAYEAHGIDVGVVAFALLQDRPDCIEYASRLHTRIDVEWSKLL